MEIETKHSDDKKDGNVTVNFIQGKDEIQTDMLKASSEQELHHRLLEMSKRVVEEGEKNVSLKQELQALRNDLTYTQNENEELRKTLLKGINDGNADHNKFSNVPVLELLRIRLQEYQDGSMTSSIPFFGFKKIGKKPKVNAHSKHQDRTAPKNESKSAPPSPKNRKEQESVTKSIPSSPRQSYVANVGDLKDKLTKMNDRSRKDRDVKSKLKEELTQSNQTIDVLSDHIEKLMVHLKHEAISKSKALGDRMRSQKEIDLLKKRSQMMEKRNERKDKVICDLKEGAKMLEDQLQLMDDKYVELKMKLDRTRTQSERVFKKKDEELKELKNKFLLVTDHKSEKGAKNKVILHNFGCGSVMSQNKASFPKTIVKTVSSHNN